MADEPAKEPVEGDRLFRKIALAIVLVIVAIIILAVVAEQSEPLPFQYEGF